MIGMSNPASNMEDKSLRNLNRAMHCRSHMAAFLSFNEVHSVGNFKDVSYSNLACFILLRSWGNFSNRKAPAGSVILGYRILYTAVFSLPMSFLSGPPWFPIPSLYHTDNSWSSTGIPEWVTAWARLEINQLSDENSIKLVVTRTKMTLGLPTALSIALGQPAELPGLNVSHQAKPA